MNKVQADEVTLDVCRGCGGTWYDRGELQAVLRGPEQARPAVAVRSRDEASSDASASLLSAAEGYLDCPRCSAKMHKRNFGQGQRVLVDVCMSHGVFLDSGELEKVSPSALPAPPSTVDVAEATKDMKIYGTNQASRDDARSAALLEWCDRAGGRGGSLPLAIVSALSSIFD